jgi:hypothetical protein
MGTQSMDERRFAELADSFGSDLDRWPATERASARHLLQQSAAARCALDTAAELDCIMGRVAPPPQPAPELRRRILAAAPAPRPGMFALLVGLWDELGGTRRAGPMLAFSLALGVVLTPLATPPDATEQDDALVNIVLTDVEHEEWLL